MDDVPQMGEVLASHSGKSSEREWNADHSVWLQPGDCIMRDKSGGLWLAHFRRLG